MENIILSVNKLTKTYADGGSIELFGQSSRKGLEEARRKMGCLVERPILSLGKTAFENLKMQQRY